MVLYEIYREDGRNGITVVHMLTYIEQIKLTLLKHLISLPVLCGRVVMLDVLCFISF